jgi:hypothetical protein
MLRRFFAIFLLFPLAAHAGAIYKCALLNGKTVYQDTLCPTGAAPAPFVLQGLGSTDYAVKTRQDKILKEYEKGQAAQQAAINLATAKQNLYMVRKSCDANMAGLKDSKNYANNNLAGATYQVGVSGEMQALAASCASRESAAQDAVDRAAEQCRAAGC